jgi:hypothetical protein
MEGSLSLQSVLDDMEQKDNSLKQLDQGGHFCSWGNVEVVRAPCSPATTPKQLHVGRVMEKQKHNNKQGTDIRVYVLFIPLFWVSGRLPPRKYHWQRCLDNAGGLLE